MKKQEMEMKIAELEECLELLYDMLDNNAVASEQRVKTALEFVTNVLEITSTYESGTLMERLDERSKK